MAERIVWALSALVEEDVEKAERHLLTALAIDALLNGPLNWISHPEYVMPEVEDLGGGRYLAKDTYSGEEVTAEFSLE